MAKTDLTAQRLRELLYYDAETGAFTWRESGVGRKRSKATAGCTAARGVVLIRIDKTLHLAHRLAFLYMTNEWPAKVVDHRDGDPANNAWANLRDVSQSTNLQNLRGSRKDNTTGFLGVWPKRNKFAAGLVVDGKAVFLGSFDTPELAHEAYIVAKRCSHEGNTL